MVMKKSLSILIIIYLSCICLQSCRKTIYCTDLPKEVWDHFVITKDTCAFSNGLDSVWMVVSQWTEYEPTIEVEFDSKWACIRFRDYIIDGYEVDSAGHFLQKKYSIGFGLDCPGKGPYLSMSSDILRVHTHWVNGTVHSSPVSISFHWDIASDGRTLNKSPWDDTLYFCKPGEPIDSVCIVKGEGLVSFYDNIDRTKWHRL